MTNFKSKITLFSLVLILISSCAINRPPKWYINPPEKDQFLFGTGTSQRNDMDLAKADADAIARDEIARQIELDIKNMIERSKMAVGREVNVDVVKDVSSQIAHQTVSGIKIVNREFKQKGKTFTFYSLAKVSLEDVKHGILEGFNDAEVRRQLDIDEKLQDQLDKEVENLDNNR